MTRLLALKIAKRNVDRQLESELAEELAGTVHHPQVDRMAEMVQTYYSQEERK